MPAYSSQLATNTLVIMSKSVSDLLFDTRML